MASRDAKAKQRDLEAELRRLAELEDSDEETEEEDDDTSAPPVKPVAPSKPVKLPKSPLKSFKDEEVEVVSRGVREKNDYLEEQFARQAQPKPRMSQASADSKVSGSSMGGLHSHSPTRGSILDEILRDSKQQQQLERNLGAGGGTGFAYWEDRTHDGETDFSEIDNFGSVAAAPKAMGSSSIGPPRASSTDGPPQRGSLMGGLPEASDKYVAARAWLMKPLPKEQPPLLCYVEREKGLLSSLSMQITYRCYMEPTDTQSTGRFLMSAKKISGKQASYFLVSMDENPDGDRGSEALLGKVRANAVGSQYTITDHGLAPDRTQAPSTLRKEMGLIKFKFDSGGPSQMDVWIPRVSGVSVPTAAVWAPQNPMDGIENAVTCRSLDRLTVLQSKHPKWDALHGGHVLNFEGRVTECSVKNFQLQMRHPEPTDDVNLQFGRVGKNKFVMDVKYPLTPFQAFGICVACMDGKIADRNGYEYLRRLTGL